MFDDNRRKYPRANYPCQLTMWFDNANHEIILANTSNIGLGGLCVHLNHEVQVGIKTDIQINFINPTTPFKCKGVVRRSVFKGDRFFDTGIQFEPLSELKFAFLDGKVSELIALEQKGKT